MRKALVLFLLSCVFFGAKQAIAQDLKTSVNQNKELDSLRKKLENSKDSVIFTSRFVRYTTLKLTKDSIQTLALDTSLRGMQNFSPIAQPRRPTINTGNVGIAAKDLLFTSSKTIGFDAGFHSLDWYAMGPDDIKYYQARTPYSNLYYAGLYSGEAEQLFRVTHSQNIKKNFNIGASYNRIGANGIYQRQRGDVLNGTFFSWYTSRNKRYTLFANAIFNTLKAYENGSITNDGIFGGNTLSIDRLSQSVRLSTARQIYRKNTFFLKQTYFVGRIDTLDQEISKKVLPTNKITYTIRYDKDSYAFQKNEADDQTVLAPGMRDLSFTNDSTSVKHIQNEFIYSFFLRGKSSSVIKNELKIDAGIRHDFYNYSQIVGIPLTLTTTSTTNGQVITYNTVSSGRIFSNYTKAFQNVTLLGSAGYRFSNRIDLNFDVQQIFQGRQAGDFLYEAKSNVLVSHNLGRIVLGGYIQNKSPEEIYDVHYGNHFGWTNTDVANPTYINYKQSNPAVDPNMTILPGLWKRTKTVNLSFKYLNDQLGLEAGADYSMINNYLYFIQKNPTVDSLTILPDQFSGSISVLKITVGKKFTYGRFNLDSYLVYQKSSQASIMPLPDFYTFNSFYMKAKVFKVLNTEFGFDVKYNTKYVNYSYSPAVSQFYIKQATEAVAATGTTPAIAGYKPIKFDSYPIIDLWVRASLRKANIFLKYEYVNQGLQSRGYYTVNRYPMQDKIFKIGLSWNFYD
ncbi:putative porin [Pedobacter sp. PAMC26386]|nr:putative porin [Pedobacter sp. PAMC26386]